MDGANQFIWNAVASVDANNNNVIDISSSGSTNSKFILTGLGQPAGPLQASLNTVWFQIRGDIYDGSSSKLLKEPGGGESYAVGAPSASAGKSAATSVT